MPHFLSADTTLMLLIKVFSGSVSQVFGVLTDQYFANKTATLLGRDCTFSHALHRTLMITLYNIIGTAVNY